MRGKWGQHSRPIRGEQGGRNQRREVCRTRGPSVFEPV